PPLSRSEKAPTPPRPPGPLQGGQRPALAARGGFGAHRIGGWNNADRPTPAPSVGWSTPRVGHQAGLRCPPYRRPEQRRPPYARAILVGWSTPALATRRGFGAHRIG